MRALSFDIMLSEAKLLLWEVEKKQILRLRLRMTVHPPLTLMMTDFSLHQLRDLLREAEIEHALRRRQFLWFDPLGGGGDHLALQTFIDRS
jgi:hypothetical protein